MRQITGGTEVPLVPPGTFSRISSMTVTPDGNFVDLVAVKGNAQVPMYGGSRCWEGARNS